MSQMMTSKLPPSQCCGGNSPYHVNPKWLINLSYRQYDFFLSLNPFFLPVQRCWIWFPVLCLNDYTLKCSATMITSSAQGIRNCNDCHPGVDSFRIVLNMSLYGQNMASESLQEHHSQKRCFTQRTINGPIYPIFLVRAFATVPISDV